MKNNSFYVAVALFILIVVQLVSGQSAQAPLHSDLSKAFGFINGQKFNLNRIKQEYPDLSVNTQKAELEFQVSFGTSERNINSALQEILAERYVAFMSNMKTQLETTLSSQPLNRELAVNFIAEVESRAKGNIPSPILETILTYQFKENPIREVLSGYSKIYRTKDHPKAKGTDFQIRYPTSWRKGEGERPNIIQKFISENGRGLEIILLMVKSIPREYQLTKKEFAGFFSDKELRGIAPNGARVISTKPIILDGQKGGMIIFDQTMQRLDVSLMVRSLYYITVHNNNMIFIQCMVSTPQGKESEMQERYNRIEPLFNWVGNSFILQEQYK